MVWNLFRKKRPVNSSIVEDPVVSSKLVRKVVRESYEIRVPYTGERSERLDKAVLELKIYADAIGYPNTELSSMVTSDGKWIIYSFEGPISIRGTDYNPLVYTNITKVEDLIREQKTF